MKRTLIAFLFMAAVILSACVPASTPSPPFIAALTNTPTPTNAPMSTTSSASTPSDLKTFIPLVEKSYRALPQRVSWQIQYTGEIDISLDVDVFNLDLFDTTPDVIDTLHQRGVFVMCYFSAGSYENWRPDSSQFPTEVLGKDLEGWPGEKWLDIRRLDLLALIMEARLDLAVQKGCDGVDPDNVNGYTNDTGFPLTYDDQITYNVFLAQAAHSRGLAIGLKNDLEQVPDLLPYFDWILNEECFTYQECDQLLPFIQAGKPVFVIEYEFTPPEFCPRANQMGFNALHKHWELDAYRTDCQQFSSPRDNRRDAENTEKTIEKSPRTLRGSATVKRGIFQQGKISHRFHRLSRIGIKTPCKSVLIRGKKNPTTVKCSSTLCVSAVHF